MDLGLSAVFLGLPNEHDIFQRESTWEIPYVPTDNFLQAAEIMAAAKLYIGNQTAMHAIADGLGLSILREAPMLGWLDNCNFRRERLWSVYPQQTYHRDFIEHAVGDAPLSYLPQASSARAYARFPELKFHVGCFSPDQVENLRDLVQSDQYCFDQLPAASLVFDVGGFSGYFSAIYMHLHPRARSVIFEPGAHKHTQIALNCPLAHLSPFAVGPSGVFEFHHVGACEGGDYLVPASPLNLNPVKSISLNRACEIYGTPDLLKIDCEGGEAFMIDDLRKLKIPTVIGEFHYNAEFPDALRSLGYDVRVVRSHGSVSGDFVAKL